MSTLVIVAGTWCAASVVTALVLGASSQERRARELADRQRAAGLTVRVRRSQAAHDLHRLTSWCRAALRHVLHGGPADRAPVWLAAVVLGALAGGLLLGFSTRGLVWDGLTPTSVDSVLQERSR